jgi:UDP-N-acetylglucosamine 2-epimerase (non-hydrolysing)
VKEKMVKNLRGVDNVRLLEPLDYVSFVSLLERVYLVLTDSGGIQEEAPSLGKPTVILRNKTDRPEAIEAQSAILAGTDEWEIERVAASLLRDEDLYWQYSRVRSVYGDGRASVRIYGFVKSHFTSQWCE